MPPTPSQFEESSDRPERRRFVRQRVRSLAYLDVVPDNGGIVLNLSENGMALQAVNPFVDVTSVTLRIQPPKSRKRIEASAEITWISDSKTEVGLRFVELSEEGRGELAEWVAAEAGVGNHRVPADSILSPSPTDPPKPIAAEPPSRREKWTAIVADSPSEMAPTNLTPPDERANVPAARDHFKWQSNVPQAEDISIRQAKVPAANVAPPNLPTPVENESHVEVPAATGRIGRVVEFPVLDSKTSATEALSRELMSPLSTDLTASAPKTLSSPVPVRKSKSRDSLTQRFCKPWVRARLSAAVPAMSSKPRNVLVESLRKPWAIPALCACTAIVFLLVGMTITRYLPKTDVNRSSLEENTSTAAATSSSPPPPEAPSHEIASPGDPSPSRETHTIKRATVRRAHFENSRTRFRAKIPASSEDRAGDTGVADFASSIEPTPIRSIEPSEDASVPAAPILPVPLVSSPTLAAVAPVVVPPPPANAERHSDCYLIYRVEPLYPRAARERRVEGTVRIHLQIGTDGRVQNLRELSGPSLLVPAALEAAREWRFIPALVNGQPVRAEKDVSIAFQLSR